MSNNKYNPLFGKKVIVIGGTSGIGLGVAEGALDRGSKVFVGSSSQTKVDKTVEELKKAFPQGEVAGMVIDMTSQASVSKFIEWVNGVGEKGIDHIVSTAGDASPIGAPKLVEVEVEAFKPGTEVRFWGVLRVAKAAAPFWNSGASLTFTSGTVGITPPKGWMTAGGMGAGVVGLARGMAVDLAPLRVNVVVPGAIRTPLWDILGGEDVKDMLMKRIAEKTLTKSVGTPADCAHAYLYLMSSTFATGSHVVVDGGATISAE